MVTVKTRAKKELRRIVETRPLAEGKYLRLTAPPVWEGEGGFGIVIDEERVGDHTVDFVGIRILLIDPGLAKNLSDSVLDFKDSPQGLRFTLDMF